MGREEGEVCLLCIVNMHSQQGFCATSRERDPRSLSGREKPHPAPTGSAAFQAAPCPVRLVTPTRNPCTPPGPSYPRGPFPQSPSPSMNTETIAHAARATLDGSMPFPEVVARLIETGVEYYHVDYVALQKRFYSAGGSVVTTPIPYEDLPSVAPELDAPALRAAIHDSQHHGQPYRHFTRRAMQAGVQGYIAFLRGQRVTYWGRTGDQHTEWFPGAKPTDA